MQAQITNRYQQEFIELLTSSPSLESVLNFHLSEAAEGRLQQLLAANQEGSLSAEEQAELDDYGLVEHLITMAKIRAWEKLNPLV